MQNICKSLLIFVLPVAMAVCLPRLTAAQAPAPQKNTALTEARKRVTDAQKAVSDLREEQKRKKDKLINDFSEKEEWKTTIPTLNKAKKDYEAAKRQATLTMKNSAEYKKTLKERDELQAKMEELQKSRDPDPRAIAKTGSALALQGTQLKKYDAVAVEQDPKASEAKEALEKAEKQMKALEDEVDTALQSDPEYAQLQQQVDQAEQQLTQAKDGLNQAVKSQADARRSSRPAPAPKRAPKSAE